MAKMTSVVLSAKWCPKENFKLGSKDMKGKLTYLGSRVWRGKQINSTVVIVARSAKKIPLTGEVFQVRRASLVGSQGHSGHGTFPRVISSMAAGMDTIPLITKKITLKEVPENIVLLQTDRKECKITAVFK